MGPRTYCAVEAVVAYAPTVNRRKRESSCEKEGTVEFQNRVCVRTVARHDKGGKLRDPYTTNCISAEKTKVQTKNKERLNRRRVEALRANGGGNLRVSNIEQEKKKD